MLGPKVSVHMLTYNHEPYVRGALDSALAQVTDFEFEIVVSDDCSTDGTTRIVKEYAARYPASIRLLTRSSNIGMNRNFIETLMACEGTYVAFLEGDDYWTSIDKLQKQADFLDSHPDFSLCCHNVMVISEGRPSFTTEMGGDHDGTVEDVIMYRHPMPTCGTMMRNVLTGVPEWFMEIDNLDYATQILAAGRGRVRYLDEPMGVYRKHSAGVSERTPASRRFERLADLLMRANEELDLRFDKLFQRRIASVYWAAAAYELRQAGFRRFVAYLRRYCIHEYRRFA